MVSYVLSLYCCTADNMLMCQPHNGVGVDIYAGFEFWTFF